MGVAVNKTGLHCPCGGSWHSSGVAGELGGFWYAVCFAGAEMALCAGGEREDRGRKVCCSPTGIGGIASANGMS